MDDHERVAFWEAVSELLQERIPRPDYYSWFAMARVEAITDTELVLSFPNEFAASWVSDRFTEVLEPLVGHVAGRHLAVRCVSRETTPAVPPQHSPEPVRPAIPSMAEPELASASPSGADAAQPAAHETMTMDQLRAELGGQPTGIGAHDTPHAVITNEIDRRLMQPLNDNYRFDTFVIGEGSQLAHAAALSVAESPGQSYNPLFVYGPSGLGKTHLLHAIGHYVEETHPGAVVAYATTEQFVNQFIRAIQNNADRHRFKEYFRGIDVLLMDDVQFLGGKGPYSQEELFHTFNHLHATGKQVVLTSDCAPSQIPQLEERLKTRFAWGLIADISAPDHATRVAILRKRAAGVGVYVPEEVLAEIATRITTNVRELEGALTRVIGLSSLTGTPISVDLAAGVLDTFVSASASGPVTIDRIQHVVCDHFHVTREDLIGPRRTNELTMPRHIAIYLARVLLNAPSTKIGKRFGDRDHSTVLSAEKKIDALIRQDPEVFDLVEQLTATIRLQEEGVQYAR